MIIILKNDNLSRNIALYEIALNLINILLFINAKI